MRAVTVVRQSLKLPHCRPICNFKA